MLACACGRSRRGIAAYRGWSKQAPLPGLGIYPLVSNSMRCRVMLSKPSLFILCLFAAGLIVSACAQPLQHSISLASGTAEPGNCTLYLAKIVESVITNQDDIKQDREFDFDIVADTTQWDLRKLQIKLERQIQKGLDDLKGCPGALAPLGERAWKWVNVYSLDSTDPDLDIRRLEEYIRSIASLKRVLERETLVPESRDLARNFALWCGSPHDNTCLSKPDHRVLYKILSTVNEKYVKRNDLNVSNLTEAVAMDQALLERIKQITEDGDRTSRIVVLGYEIPWDADETSIRYGVAIVLEDQQGIDKNLTYKKDITHQFIGFSLFYANEATPLPRVLGESLPDPPLPVWKRALYATGYPIAVLIGVKNSAFELLKMPFSLIGGLVAGRGYFWEYPLENAKSAWNTLVMETSTWPSYGFPTGVFRLLGETPLVGQIFHLNTGPASPDFDKRPSGEQARRKVFLSRGIYGGNEWGQDTGLWSGWMRTAYPYYDVYSPPYLHGTVTDVVWSMFNLSHGPAYNEALYIRDRASRLDRLYLSGHSGGVQRSAVASRILTYHGYSVVGVVGIAGPNIGQAFVDERYPNAFQIFLNTQPGAHQDIVSKVGAVAGVYSAVLDAAILRVPKYVVGGIAGIIDDRWREGVYRYADLMGFTNAVRTEITRKVNAEHATPLRLTLSQPMVLDAYVRNELANAFRDDLNRPSLNRVDKAQERLQDWLHLAPEPGIERRGDDSDKDRGTGAMPWRR